MGETNELIEMMKDTLRAVVGEFYDEDKDPEIIEKIAIKIAKEKILQETATNDRERIEHERNIRHLLVTIRSIVVSRYVKSYNVGLTAFLGVVDAIIGIIVKAVFSQIK